MIYIFIHKNVTKIFVSYTQSCVYLQYQINEYKFRNKNETNKKKEKL